MQTKSTDITDSEIRQNIGSILPYYPITDAERKRISELMRSERLPNHVFTRYASKTDWYKEGFEKRKQIDGFRKGKGGYHKQAIPMLIEHLWQPSSPNYELCWKIYQAAAIKYVQVELPILDKLLVEVGYDGDENDSSQLLKSICSNAMDYDVTAADVAKFYEVWWLNRVENVDQILSLCAQHDESRVQARAIRKLSLLLDDLNKSVVALTQVLTAHSTRLAQSEAMTEKNNQKLSEQQNAITSLKEQLANLSTDFSEGANSIAVFEQRLNKLSEALIPLRQQVHDRVTTEALKTAIKDLREELMSFVGSTHETQLATLKNETLDFIGDAINEFDQKLANFSADVETRTARTDGSGAARTTSSRYESTLFSGLDQSRLAAKPAQEVDFLMSWSRDLSGIGFSHSNEALLAYHLILLASTATVTSHKLAKSWINSLGWASFQKQMVATPTWSAEEDWASGVEYLFGDKASKEPKVLIIHNYDIGLVDCYLAPTLLHWAVSEARNGMITKIFLIPSIEATLPSFQILDHAAYLLPKPSDDASGLCLIDGLAGSFKHTKKLSSPVDPKSMLQWRASTGRCDYDLTPIQNSFGLELSDWVVQSFRRTVSMAHKFFQEPSAVGIGMYHHVLPWVRSRYKESDHGELGAYLKQLPDIRY